MPTESVEAIAGKFAQNPLRTRTDVERLLRDMIDPVRPHFSPGRAQVQLGPHRASYGDPVGLMEGFARPLWGLAPLAAGGGEFAHWDLWREGLDHGTDPSHPEFWGRAGNHDQRNVEMAALATALVLARGQLWDPLSRDAQARVAEWLYRINEVQLVENNWLFFRVLVNGALQQLGQRHSATQLVEDAARIDGFYLGRGWYRDGPPGPLRRNGRVGDYYVPMAFHYYGLLCGRVGGGANRAWTEELRGRAREFARDFVHYFAADGAAIPFGRSLTYRFAQGAFWGALAYADEEAMPWADVKGIYLRHLREWMRRPIFSDTGVLTIGYGYPNIVMTESYNSSASPYWAMKAFLPLALPDSHPFWSAEEAELPVRSAVRTIPEANAIFVTATNASDAVMITPGQDVQDWPRHGPQKYAKFAYSAQLGFSVATGSATRDEGGFDSVLALSDDGRRFRAREQCFDCWVEEGVAFSRCRPWPDVEVQTWLIAEWDAHVRVHRVQSARRLWSLEAGFAAGFVRYDSATTSIDDAGAAWVRTPHGESWIRELGAREGSAVRHRQHVRLGPNSHLLYPLAIMPTLQGEHAAGDFWLMSVAGGGVRGKGANAEPGLDFGVQVNGEAGVAVTRGGREWKLM